MEAFSLYALSLVVVFVSFSLHFLTKRCNSNKYKLPPGTFGFPLIGETLKFFSSGPEEFIRQKMKKYSEEVFATSLLGQKVAVVCGPAGNKFLLYTANRDVDPWFPSAVSNLLNLVYNTEEQSVKQIVSKNRNFLYNEILKPEILRKYITIMDSMAREHIKSEWDPSQIIKAYPVTKKYSLSLACRLLLGVEDAIQVEKISESFRLTLQGLLSMPIKLPGTKYNRSFTEIKKLHQLFLKMIAEKKKAVLVDKERSGSLDVLSRMLLEGSSHFTSDSEIALHLFGLMLPSYEATSSSIGFVLKFLAELPHVYDLVYKELMEIAQSKAPHELLNWEDVKKMKYSSNVICESMRLIPPSMGTFRAVDTDINFAGITVPKGWKMFWSPFTTNKNPKYFPNPETFDPTRYDGDGPTPCTFLPFSAGPRMCPGKEYSMFVILVYMYDVVTKFKVQTVIPDEKITYIGAPVPVNGLPMRVLPLQK